MVPYWPEVTVVSIDTLKQTTQSLIETLSEVKRMHEECAQNRKNLNSELQNLEVELKKNVTNVGIPKRNSGTLEIIEKAEETLSES